MSSRKHELIRKLLALASDPGASPNEAATASRQAAALMAKHNIDLSELAEEELKLQFDMIVAEARGCRPGKKNPSEVPTWIGYIAWGIKLYTRTRLRTGRGVLHYMGPREDVELAQWLSNLLVEGCYAASEGRGISEANAFRNGYAGALQSRFKQMVKDRDHADAEVSATALVRVDTVRQRMMDQMFGSDNSGKTSHAKSSMEGRAAGLKAAIPSGRPVGHSCLRLR